MRQKFSIFVAALREVFFACPRYHTAMAICLLVTGLMPAVNVYATGQMIALFNHSQAQHAILTTLGIWGVSMLLPSLFEPLVNYLQTHINQLVTNSVINKLMAKNASFNGLQVYDDTNIQDDIAVLKSQSKFRPTNFMVNLVNLTRETVTVAALFAMLFSIKWWIPFAILLAATPLAYANFQVMSFSWRALISSGKQSRLMDYFASLAFSRETQKDSHLFNANPLIVDKYQQAFKQVYSELQQAQFKIFSKPIPFQIIAVVVLSLVLFALYQQAAVAAITLSSAVVLLQSIMMLNNRLESVIQTSSLTYEILDYFEKYFAFLAYEENIIDGNLSIQRIERIEFIHVGFTYPNTDKPILKNISFSARKGESIAIVGHNGAGKSTLVSLICRFWDVSEGQILINGENIKAYKISELRACMGAVFQDFAKFTMTINENIMLNHQPAPNQQAVKQELGLLPTTSLDTLIGRAFDGVELSGGQWQKLAILRCMNATSSLIILDEPTSAIDPKAEIKLYDAFKQLSTGKLSFMITHRLGSINSVDRVLVIDQGSLVQDGDPTILKQETGVFKELWLTQAAMYE